MKKLLAYLLVIIAIAAGVAFVACGGGGDDDEDKPSASENKDNSGDEGEATAEETDDEDADQGQDADAGDEEDKDADEDSDSDGDSSGSLEGVPVYPGANETMKGEWSGDEAMIPFSGGEGTSADQFDTVKYGIYETDDSAEEVFSWYKDHMGDWKEDWSMSSSDEEGGGGIGIWSKNDGKQVVWITVGEEGDSTSLMIMTGGS